MHRLGYVYFAVAVPLLLCCLLVVPPMQVPDEQAHYFRAVQLAGGQWRTQVAGSLVGGHVDAAAFALAKRFCEGGAGDVLGMCRDKDRDLDAAELKNLWRTKDHGQQAFAYFPTTVRYFPAAYLPQALGLRLGRGLGAYGSFLLARALSALCSALLIAYAIQISRRFSLLLFVMALLPMALFEMASLSQDAAIIAVGFVMAGTLSRGDAVRRRDFVAFALGLLMAGLARPPLVALAPLLLLPQWRHKARVAWQTQLGALTACLAASALWTAYMARFPTAIIDGQATSVMPQVAYLVEHPTAFVAALVNSVRLHGAVWASSFVGVLGWLDVILRDHEYALAGIALICATLHGATNSVFSYTPARHVVAAVTVSVLGTFLLTYVTWREPGGLTIEGIQGRYFFSYMPLLAVVLPSMRPRPLTKRLLGWLSGWAALVCIALVVRGGGAAIWSRYGGYAYALREALARHTESG